MNSVILVILFFHQQTGYSSTTSIPVKGMEVCEREGAKLVRKSTAPPQVLTSYNCVLTN